MSKRPGDPGYPAGWCIHYRSAGRHDTCEKGVPYDSFKGDDAKFDRRPCFTAGTHERAHCGHRRVPTADEIEAHEAWAKERRSVLFTVLEGIMPWRQRWSGKSHSEVVECPACGGRLHLSISGYNGHVHGRCETPGCVSWME
ncbi:MAG TPA: hypothetical protein VGF29_05850 [Hyphomicrobiaceae bacterium]|jgi:hypothetical protein